MERKVEERVELTFTLDEVLNALIRESHGGHPDGYIPDDAFIESDTTFDTPHREPEMLVKVSWTRVDLR